MRLSQNTDLMKRVSTPAVYKTSKTLRINSSNREEALIGLFGRGKQAQSARRKSWRINESGYTPAQKILIGAVKTIGSQALSYSPKDRASKQAVEAVNRTFNFATEGFPKPGANLEAWQAWQAASAAALINTLKQYVKSMQVGYSQEIWKPAENAAHVIDTAIKSVIEQEKRKAASAHVRTTQNIPSLGYDLKHFSGGYTEAQINLLAFLIEAGTIDDTDQKSIERQSSVKRALKDVPKPGHPYNEWKLWSAVAKRLVSSHLNKTESRGRIARSFGGKTLESEDKAFNRLMVEMLADTNKTYPSEPEKKKTPEELREENKPADIPASLQGVSSMPSGNTIRLTKQGPKTPTPVAPPAKTVKLLPSPQTKSTSKAPAKKAKKPSTEEKLMNLRQKKKAGQQAGKDLKKIEAIHAQEKKEKQEKLRSNQRNQLTRALIKHMTQHINNPNNQHLTNTQIISINKKLIDRIGLSARRVHQILNDLRKKYKVSAPARKTTRVKVKKAAPKKATKAKTVKAKKTVAKKPKAPAKKAKKPAAKKPKASKSKAPKTRAKKVSTRKR